MVKILVIKSTLQHCAFVCEQISVLRQLSNQTKKKNGVLSRRRQSEEASQPSQLLFRPVQTSDKEVQTQNGHATTRTTKMKPGTEHSHERARLLRRDTTAAAAPCSGGDEQEGRTTTTTTPSSSWRRPS
jgi:hypothetical protein